MRGRKPQGKAELLRRRKLRRVEIDAADRDAGEGFLRERRQALDLGRRAEVGKQCDRHTGPVRRSEEHTSELQSLMRISYAVLCLNKKKNMSRAAQPSRKKIKT